LGGYYYGYTSHGLDAFSKTLGLETFTKAELIELVGEDETLHLENWDELSENERIDLLETHAAEGQASLEEAEGKGILGAAERIPRTIAFTILAFTQMFEVMAIHAGDRTSFFRDGFKKNWLLMWAVLSTLVLQVLVIYVPFMQDVFKTASLSLTEFLITAVLGSVILFAVELEKMYITRRERAKHA